MSYSFLIKRIPLPAGQMTPINAPWACNYFSLKSASGNPLTVATDPEDETQRDTLPANGQEVVVVARIGGWRWQNGDAVIYAQPAGQADEVAIVKFLA